MSKQGRKNHFISSTPLKGPPDKSQPRITSSSRQTIIFATGPLAKRWNVVSLFQCDLVNQTTFTSRRPTPLLPIHCLTKPSKDTRKPDKNLKFTTSVTYLGVCNITKFKNVILIPSNIVELNKCNNSRKI